MPINRDDLPSIQYWRQSPARIAQRSYVSFCLFMSSVQDTFLGLMERERHNLNWSATCSYYGLVHGGRLLCFLAFGDFPTSHAALRKILFTGPFVDRQEGRCNLDWLAGFGQLQPRPPQPPLDNFQALHGELREALFLYLTQIRIENSEGRVGGFGAILDSAAPLRNDSNYEALLIAHEYHHVLMSRAFESLADAMSRGATACLPLLADLFSSFLSFDPDLEDNRPAYRAFFSEYVNRRVAQAIRRKLDGLPELQDQLQRFVLGLQADVTLVDYAHLEEMISLDAFDPKLGLMSDFGRKIRGLCEAIQQARQ